MQLLQCVLWVGLGGLEYEVVYGVVWSKEREVLCTVYV